MKLSITQKDIFSKQVKKGANPEELFLFDGNNFFGQTSETELILPKTVFHPN